MDHARSGVKPANLGSLGLLLLLAVACGGSEVRDPAGSLSAVVSVEYVSGEDTLYFVPGRLSFDGDPWANHMVEFSISTDGYVQTLDLYDRYSVEDGRLVPAAGAKTIHYELSDEEPFGGSFGVALPELPEGENRITLTLLIHLEPARDNGLTTIDGEMTIDFVYEVFWADSPVAAYCARADQLLRAESNFSPDAFIEEGSGVLTSDELTRFEEAIDRFNDEVTNNGHWDPSEFFDLIEEICDVKYDERWDAYS